MGSAIKQSPLSAIGILLFVSFVADDANAASIVWQPTSGLWSSSVNWSPAQVPTVLDSAYINNGGTASIVSGIVAVCNSLNLGTTPGGSGTVQLLSGGSLVVSAQENIGTSGNGTFTQSGGTNMLGSLGQLHFGASAGSVYILNGGLLAVGSGGIISDAGGSPTFNVGGGTLGATVPWSTSVNVTLTGNGGNAAVDTTGGSITLNGVLSGAGGLVKAGSGTLSLNNANGYSGDTSVSAGTLVIGGGGELNNGAYSGNIAIGSGAVFNYNSSALQDLSGVISGSGALTVSSVFGGRLTLYGSNTYTGLTAINSGTLRLGNTAALAGGGSITFGGGTLQFSPSNSQDYAGRIVNSTAPIQIDATNVNAVFTGNLASSNTAGLTLSGGILTLAGSNTFTGVTLISGGDLKLSNTAALAGNGPITFAGGYLLYTVSNTQDYSGRIVNSVAAMQFDTNGQNVNLAGSLPGSNFGGLTKFGAGMLTLAASNSYTGTTLVSGGSLVLANVNALGPSVFDSSGVGALSFGALTASTFAGLQGSGGLSLSNTSGAAVGLSVGGNGQSTTFTGVLSGPGSLIKQGSGTLLLGGANTFSGSTAVSAGTLTVSGSGSLGGGAYTGNLAIANGAVFNYNSSAAQTLGGAISGNGGIVKNGAGLLTLSGNNSFNGNTTITTGTLAIGGSGWLGGGAYTGNIAIGSGDQFKYSSSAVQAISGAISGGGLLVQTGGVLTLSGTNTYAGGTSVNGGSLLAVSTASLPGYNNFGTISVAGGAVVSVQANSNGTSGWSAAQIDSLRAFANWQSSTAGLGIDTTQGNFNYGSNISQGLSLYVTGTNTLTLSGSNTYTGLTSIGSGTLQLTNSAALAGNGNITFGGGMLQYIYSNPQDYSGRIVNSAAAMQIDTYVQNVTFANSLATSNSGGLTKFGAGTLSLTASNAFSGPTLVAGGTLLLANSNALAGSTFDTSGAGTLSFGTLTDATFAGLQGSGSLALNNANAGPVTLTVGGNGQSTAFAGNLSGSGNLTKIGSGTLTLTGSSTLPGYTMISAGTLQILSGELQCWFFPELVGSAGTGTNSGSTGSMVQSGGTNIGDIIIGDFYGGVGSYFLSGSGLLTGSVRINAGTFTQSGGTNNIYGDGGTYGGLSIGFSVPSVYNFSGGLLTAYRETVGVYNNGTFTQSGGTNSVGTLELCSTLSYGINGVYNLNGGLLLVGSGGIVGGAAIPPAPENNPTFNFGGGTLGASLSWSSTVNMTLTGSGGNSTIDTTGGSIGLSGALSGSGGLVVVGSGGLTLSGNMSGYSGTLQNFSTINFLSNVFGGRLVNSGTVNFSSSLLVLQGIENDTAVTVPAGALLGVSGGNAALDNEGTMFLAGGTVAGGAAAGSGGPIVNNGVISGYGALTSGVGITNNAQIIQSGGNLTFAGGTAGAINDGTIVLAQGYQFILSGSTLTNTQGINLNSGMIAGSGLLNNTSGNVSGPGTVTARFANSGGILSVPPGTTNIAQPFTNSGAIQITGFGASLSGGAITNLGDIQGSGAITNSCSNAGTIEAVGGALTFSGSVQNGSAGLISAGAGGKILVLTGLASNTGIINLSGGIFDNNGHILSNSGQISGYGTWHTGGLTNLGTISFSGATSTITGNVTNASGGSVSVSYNPAVFTGAVVNNGYYKISGTTVTYAGNFLNNGTYLSDPATNNFASLSIGPSGLLEGGVGDYFYVTGLFTNAGDIDLGGSSKMLVGNGAGTLTQSAGTLELGGSASFTAGLVQINGGILRADGPGALATASLVYDSPAASTYQGTLAGTGNTLTVNNPASLLALSGTANAYTGGTFVTAGELLVTSLGGIQSGTNLSVGSELVSFAAPVPSSAAVPVPEPRTLMLLGTAFWGAAIYRFFRQRRAIRQ
jgi:autotransporter-associated beta strand protein